MAASQVETTLKKPTCAYFAWFNAERDNICKQLGTKSLKEVGTKAGEMWKAMSDDKKKPFVDEYNRQKAEYEKFKETDAGKKALEEEKAGRKEKKEAKVDKAVKAAVKSVEKDDKLKKPQSAYFMYLNDNREHITAELNTNSLPAVTKRASEMWKALSETDRKPWDDKATRAKEAHEAYLKTPEGAAALQAYKDATQAAKGDVKGFKASEKKEAEPAAEEAEAPSPGNKRKKAPAGEGGASVPSPKKAKVTSPKQGKGKRAQQEEPKAVLPADVIAACKVAQKKANSDVNYEFYLRKLLETEKLVKKGLTPQQGLKALETSGGLLNKARNELCAQLGA